MQDIHPTAEAIDSTPTTMQQLRVLDKAALESLFARGSAERLPEGRLTGYGLALPGTLIGRFLGALVRMLLWKGKVFYPGADNIKNLISPFGFEAFRGVLKLGNSRLDGAPAILVDYGKPFGRKQAVGDELREIAPGLYLGRGFDGDKTTVYFAVENSGR